MNQAPRCTVDVDLVVADLMRSETMGETEEGDLLGDDRTRLDQPWRPSAGRRATSSTRCAAGLLDPLRLDRGDAAGRTGGWSPRARQPSPSRAACDR